MSTLFQLSLLFFCLVISAFGQAPKRRFEYKLSFKGPHLVQRDNTVPFWEYFGDALAGDEGIRITPSLRSKKGSVWSKNKLENNGWEIEAGLRIAGRGRIGADGMAIWFTENRASAQDDPNTNVVFGAADKWNGLGVFLDSFDNDGQHNNPYIMGVVNNGQVSYDHQSDGSNQHIGGCLRDFRNKPFPVRIKIEYYNNMLTVRVNNGLTNNANDFEICFTAMNVVLPASGYVGISAATGGLADDHDALYLLTHTLHDPTAQTAQISDAEREKFEREFKQYQEELDRAKQQYQQEHPDDRMNQYDDEDGDWFQGQNEKELRQIFDGQNMIHQALREMGRKVDELVGRQEMVISRLNSMPTGQQVGGQPPPPQVGQQQGGQINMQATIQRHEVDRVLNNQNSLLQQLGELKYTIADVQQKAMAIQSQGGQRAGGGALQDPIALHEFKDKMNNVANDVRTLLNRPQGQVQCPSTGGCLSTTFFLIALVVQFVLTIGYMVYRSNRDAQAKKFY
ncbi:ergic-53 like protein [Plakobranchus ocellatus]|uniref:Ergic-53 like protein n=1 Tax=Plakobranchus ocellatus TaxID=259542 RepID=A0AAV3YPB1_9GAST|nr:ergic-53 like protein [Plakobranchus ocellatus]